MIDKNPKRPGRAARLLLIVSGALLANGTCANLQTPPDNTESFFGIAIARGAEVTPQSELAQPQAIDAAAAEWADMSPWAAE